MEEAPEEMETLRREEVLWAGGLQGGELGEIHRRRGRKRLDSRNREGQRWQRRWRRVGEHICYNILGFREGDKVAGKL